MAAPRAATPEQTAFLAELLKSGLLISTGVPGVYGQGEAFEKVRVAFTALVAREAASDGAESMHFPPLLPRYQLETNGYLDSFPHLAGIVFSFDGTEAEARALGERAAAHEPWADLESISDVVLGPAACYPVYPELARRGPLPVGGATVDTGSAWVFRHEPSDDPARMQIFHMYELARIADPADIAEYRNTWLVRAAAMFGRLGLTTASEIASDPFFGRVGRMLAANQLEQELKFELVAMIGGPEPTAIASFNYHQDHFTKIYDLALEGGGVAHSGCVAFGIERVTLALFRAHGLDVASWPAGVQAELWR